MGDSNNWSWAGEHGLRADRRPLVKLWAVAGLALAAIGTAWLAYSYRQSDAAAPTIGAAEAASLREILVGIPADAELVRPIPSRPAS
jgi:hypothetical protein